MFEEFADLHNGKLMLNKTSLSKLMDYLGHHEDEAELACIMKRVMSSMMDTYLSMLLCP